MLAIEERVSDRTILLFLPIYDNLHRAFASYASDKSVSTFISGVEQIFAQFDQLLEQRAVSRIEAVGERFDPALHDALLSVESEEAKNTIVEEFAPGYVRNDRVLQPSKVSVSQGPAQSEKESQ
jgi:molecular chaperone GrpE